MGEKEFEGILLNFKKVIYIRYTLDWPQWKIWCFLYIDRLGFWGALDVYILVVRFGIWYLIKIMELIVESKGEERCKWRSFEMYLYGYGKYILVYRQHKMTLIFLIHRFSSKLCLQVTFCCRILTCIWKYLRLHGSTGLQTE